MSFALFCFVETLKNWALVLKNYKKKNAEFDYFLEPGQDSLKSMGILILFWSWISHPNIKIDSFYNQAILAQDYIYLNTLFLCLSLLLKYILF